MGEYRALKVKYLSLEDTINPYKYVDGLIPYTITDTFDINMSIILEKEKIIFRDPKTYIGTVNEIVYYGASENDEYFVYYTRDSKILFQREYDHIIVYTIPVESGEHLYTIYRKITIFDSVKNLDLYLRSIKK